MERYIAQPGHRVWGWEGALVLPQLDDGTDLVDFLGEALFSPWSRCEVEGGEWVEQEERREGELGLECKT